MPQRQFAGWPKVSSSCSKEQAMKSRSKNSQRRLHTTRQWFVSGAVLTPRRKKTRRLSLEQFESRYMLSTIVWGNRGDSSDNFDDAFGAGAPADAARAVVDGAIDAWNRVIVNFNHDAGISPPDLIEDISIDTGDSDCGASTSTTIGSDGK